MYKLTYVRTCFFPSLVGWISIKRVLWLEGGVDVTDGGVI